MGGATRRTRTPARVAAAEAAILGGALVALGALYGRHLGIPSAEFDEGVYLAIASALSAGAELGREVFSSQPPLFFALLRTGYDVAAGDPTAVRALALLFALLACGGAYAVVRGVAGPGPGVAAALLVGLAPGFWDGAGVVSADIPAMALALLALAAGAAAARRPAWGLAAGALMAAAVLVKLLALPFVVALAVAAVTARVPRRAVLYALAGGLAVTGAVLFAYADALAPILHTAVAFQARAQRAGVPTPRVDTFTPALLTAYAGLLATLAAGLVAQRPESWRRWLRARAPLIVLLALGLAVLVLQRPLFRHHLAAATVPLALLAATALPSLPRPRALGPLLVGLVLLVLGATGPGERQLGRDLLVSGERAAQERAAAIVRGATAPDAPVVSDLPLVPLFAGRPVAPATADPSFARVGGGSLDLPSVMGAAEAAGALVVGRAFTALPGLDAEARRRFPRLLRADGIRVYLRAEGRVEPRAKLALGPS